MSNTSTLVTTILLCFKIVLLHSLNIHIIFTNISWKRNLFFLKNEFWIHIKNIDKIEDYSFCIRNSKFVILICRKVLEAKNLSPFQVSPLHLYLSLLTLCLSEMTYRSPVLCRQTQQQPSFSGNSHPTVEAVPPSLRAPPNTPWWVMVQQPLTSPSTRLPWRMLVLTGAPLLILWARARIPRPWRSQEVSDGVVVWWLYAQLLENFVSYSKKSGEGNTVQHFF